MQMLLVLGTCHTFVEHIPQDCGCGAFIFLKNNYPKLIVYVQLVPKVFIFFKESLQYEFMHWPLKC